MFLTLSSSLPSLLSEIKNKILKFIWHIYICYILLEGDMEKRQLINPTEDKKYFVMWKVSHWTVRAEASLIQQTGKAQG